MKHKKILLGSMSAVMAVAAPVATVVACGNAKKATPQVNVVFETAIKKAKNETYSSLSNGVFAKDPFEHFAVNAVKQLMEGVAKIAPSMKVIINKLNQTTPKQGNKTWFDVIAHNIKQQIFNEKNIVAKGNNDQSLVELAKKFNNPKLGIGPNGALQIPIRDVVNKIIPAINQGYNPLPWFDLILAGQSIPSTAKIDSLTKTFDGSTKVEKGLIKGPGSTAFLKSLFADHFDPVTQTTTSPIKTMVTDIAFGLTGVNPIDTIINLAHGVIDSLSTGFTNAKVQANELYNVIKELNGKSFNINLNIFGATQKISVPKIEIDSTVLTTLKNATGKAGTLITIAKTEIDKLFNSFEFKGKNLLELLVSGVDIFKKKSTSSSSSKGQGGSKNGQNGGNTPIKTVQNPMKAIADLLDKALNELSKPSTLNTILDIFDLIISIGESKQNSNLTNFAKEANINAFKDVAGKFGAGEKGVSLVQGIFKTLDGLASMYR